MAARLEVSAGLVFHGGKLLIAQRCADVDQANLWEFPGGKREAGETFEQCLVRELREELGIETDVLALYREIEHDYPTRHVRLRFFRCRLIEGEPQPLGCQAVAWVTRDELSQYEFPKADVQLLADLQSDISVWNPEQM